MKPIDKNTPAKENVNFICAGAQKAGTTWLYGRLRELPEFSLLPIKEVHYFDRSRKYPSPNTLSIQSLLSRLSKFDWTKKALLTTSDEIKNRDFERFKWMVKWYFSNYNDRWYLSLFETFKGITGEITPDYSMIHKTDIKNMHELLPDIKLIFLLRNPVERAWSHYKYNKFVFNSKSRLLKFEKKSEVYQNTNYDINEIFRFMNSDAQQLRSNYIQTIKKYSSVYPENQILIGFYDAISNNPEELLSEIVEFIGGDSTNILEYCKLEKKNNRSPQFDMPKEVEIFLKNKYKPIIRELSDLYGEYFTKWYDDMYNNKKKKGDSELLSPAIVLG